ncbi:MAG: hypothetical protein U0N20_07990 [Clostridium sp.]
MSKKKKSGEKLRENHDWQVKIIISYKLVLAYIIKSTMKEFEDVPLEKLPFMLLTIQA